MARLLQVKDYNYLMTEFGNHAMVMTTGNGSMADKPREKGYVVFESPSLGDQNDYAKWLPNREEAQKEFEARA